MKKEFKKLGLILYHEKLQNGLNIYVVPKDNVNDIYVTYTTKYGSIDTSFILDGKKVDTPLGVAHFLEHKLFEQKNGKDPFSMFDKNGASANAATYHDKTTYLFSGPKNFKKNLKILLNFVNEPYFTDENVEKEKGIILQELKMGEDSSGRVGYTKSLYNAIINDKTKYKIIGTEESIRSIKKEDLYTCYEAFYQPNNMILVVTGNVDANAVFDTVKSTLKAKKSISFKKIEYEEPDKVAKKTEIVNMHVSIPKLYFTFKINIKNLDIEKRFVYKYLSIYFDSLYGSVSDFQEEIEEKNICNSELSVIFTRLKDHIIVTLSGESNNPEKLSKLIKKYIGKNITIDDFKRKKKVLLSSSIYLSDNIYHMNTKIVNDILYYGEVMTNIYEENENLKYEELTKILNNINFNNYCEVYLKEK